MLNIESGADDTALGGEETAPVDGDADIIAAAQAWLAEHEEGAKANG